MFVIGYFELIYPTCSGELVVAGGSERFGVLRCGSCGSLYPVGNYFPGVPDLRPKELRVEVFELAWFGFFGVECRRRYGKDFERRMIELPYYVAFLKECYSSEYQSDVERYFLERFRRAVGEGRVLRVGCGDGKELRLIGRRGLCVDILPSSAILSSSLGIRTILADALKMPFRDEVFDGVLAIQSLEYILIRQTYKVLSEIRRVLKPSGITLLSLEKASEGIDTEFNYVYENECIIVKKHFHRGWGREGLKAISELFEVIEFSDDRDYYYVMAMKNSSR